MKIRAKPGGFEIVAITVMLAVLLIASATSAFDNGNNGDGRGHLKTIPPKWIFATVRRY